MVAGYFAARGGQETLDPWEEQSYSVGTLDHGALARVIHALTRNFVGRFRKGESPPEVYVTDIAIIPKGSRGGIIEKSRSQPKVRTRTHYRDTVTGHFITRATYERSRRAIRAAAKRKGAKPGRGRFIRTTETYTL